MSTSRAEIREWESRWMRPVAISCFLLAAALVGSQFANSISGDGDAEVLRSVDEHGGSLVASGVLQTIGFLLMAVPLYYLFRSAQARSDRVRGQFVGLILIAPLFLAISSGLTIDVRSQAADMFVAGEAELTLTAEEARKECEEELDEKGAKDFADDYPPAGGETSTKACEKQKSEDDEASNALTDASLTGLVSGLGLAGGLGLVVSFLYTGLWGMRTGLLTRFWGSLGMVAGFAFILGPLFAITLLWFVFFGLLLLGVLPGGRPPAWDAGEAIPWPTPGEKAAKEMQADPDAIDVDSEEVDDPGSPGPNGRSAPPKKRKRRE